MERIISSLSSLDTPDSEGKRGTGKGAGRKPLEVGTEEVKSLVSSKLYRELGGDEACAKVIPRARERLSAMLHSIGVEYSAYSETQHLSLRALGVYEMFLFHGDERGGERFLRMATRLIESRYRPLGERTREAICRVGRSK